MTKFAKFAKKIDVWILPYVGSNAFDESYSLRFKLDGREWNIEWFGQLPNERGINPRRAHHKGPYSIEYMFQWWVNYGTKTELEQIKTFLGKKGWKKLQKLNYGI